jgi:hypothetical protein
MNSHLFFYFLVFSLVTCGTSARAQDANYGSLRSGRKVALNKDIQTLEQHIKTACSQQGGGLYYMIFQDPGIIAGSIGEGLSIENKLPRGVFLIYCDQPLSEAQIKQAGVKSWAAVMPQDKRSAWWSDNGDTSGFYKVLIDVVEQAGQTSFLALLRSLNITPDARQAWANQHIWTVEASFAQIKKLCELPIVKYVQPEWSEQPVNGQAVGFTNAEIARQPASMGGYDLQGEGVTIGVGDNAIPTHIDYVDRLQNFNPLVAETHGIHTTGTVGGNGIVDERYRGFAPSCHLITDFFSQIISNAAVYHDNFGMVLTNNSYGAVLGSCSHAGVYDLYSQYLDQQAFDIPDLLNVFAAANDGRLTCNPFPLGYSTVTGSYSTAKNVLTVANIGRTQASFNQSSSCGPVKDGRLKPEITAMGTGLISGGIDNTYVRNSGTSMATPNVTGASGLLYQRYRQLHGNQNPENALVKVLLMNGADDLDIPGPDYRFGFGLMNLGRTLDMLDHNRYTSNTISNNQTQSISVSIPPQTAIAKIMLYWNDPAASPLVGPNLVNDLDLSVTTPGNNTVLPLTPNPNPAQVMQPALPGADHLNNVEQVVLQNPVAGNYTIEVKGFHIPQGNQTYYVAYDFVKEGIAIQYPFGGESLIAGDSIFIYWQASPGSQSFTFSYSTDNGNSWVNEANQITADKRAYIWQVPETIASGNCRIRITRNGQTAQSNNFSIIGRPLVVPASAAIQCPGSVRFSWNTVGGADQYKIFKKQGAGMMEAGTTTDTFYTLYGLDPDSIYWIAVAPVVDNEIAMRSIAFSVRPDHGNCSAITQHGDLRLASVLHPQSGRMHTLSELGTNEPFQVTIQNLDNQVANHYQVLFRLNNDPWQSQVFTLSINSGATGTLTLPGLDLAAAGDYQLQVAVRNMALPDPVSINDSLTVVIRQLRNDPLTLVPGSEEDFEGFPSEQVTGTSVMGIGHSDRWDFTTDEQAGRWRSFVTSNICLQGNRSMSMDNAMLVADSSSVAARNLLTGTFNFTGYLSQSEEIRCTFDYILHGVPKFDSGNQVWVRGSDSDPWLPFFTYQKDMNSIGQLHSSGSVSFNDVLNAAGQSFSSATQVRFGQRDTSLIGSVNFGNGLTLDEVKVYQVFNDIQLLSVDSIYHFNCALSNTVPLSLTLRNGVFNTVFGIAVSYSLDGQPPVTEIIPSIAGKDTLIHTFSVPMDLSATGLHHLSAWVHAPNDSYALNDSVLDFSIRNQPVIDRFPYLQDFEQGEGFFYAEGTNSSWAYGKPVAPLIGHAASGEKAWKTNLSGSYNDLEASFLYSPCFDISQLQNPTLSFSLASDIEAPADGNIYDRAYVEYTTDGYNWEKLGAAGEGTNWYNNDSAQIWARPGETYWHVATIPLPQVSGNIALRFVLRSDQGAAYEGIALDDVHIYDLDKPISEADSFQPAISRLVPAGDEVLFSQNNEMAVWLKNGSGSLGQTVVQRYRHAYFINQDSSQYFLPENFVLKSEQQINDSVLLRLYILEADMKKMREDSACPSCTRSDEIYRLGISRYRDADKTRENKLLEDDKEGTWSFIPWQRIRYVPYDKGYYAELHLKDFGELWFNNGGPDGDKPISAHLFDFQARHQGRRLAKLTWYSLSDAHTLKYEVQRADTSLEFETIYTVDAVQENGHEYSYVDSPVLHRSFVLYRIRYHHQDGTVYLSPVRRLDWSDVDGDVLAYPNPVRDGKLHLSWFKGEGSPLDWTLYDFSGRNVKSGEINENNFTGGAVLDIGRWGLVSGIYILKIRSGRYDWAFKIVYQENR